MGYKNFREVYHKLAIVLDHGYCLQLFRATEEKTFPKGIEANSALVYGYIDKSRGFSYKVLGLTYYEDGDYTLIRPNEELGMTVRGECFEDFELIPIENKAFAKQFEIPIAICNRVYSKKVDELLRSFTFLDPFRHHDHPDDILAVLFIPNVKPEKIWVRCKEYVSETEGRHFLTAQLLNEPFSDFGVHQGDEIMLAVFEENGEHVALCFPKS